MRVYVFLLSCFIKIQYYYFGPGRLNKLMKTYGLRKNYITDRVIIDEALEYNPQREDKQQLPDVNQVYLLWIILQSLSRLLGLNLFLFLVLVLEPISSAGLPGHNTHTVGKLVHRY